MVDPTLRPCPFCRGGAEFKTIHCPNGRELWGVVCRGQCGVELSVSDNKAEAGAIWNTRAAPEDRLTDDGVVRVLTTTGPLPSPSPDIIPPLEAALPDDGVAMDAPPPVYPPCKGRNCGCTDGLSHSRECELEHNAAYLGARVTWPDAAPAAPDDAVLRDATLAEVMDCAADLAEATQRLAELEAEYALAKLGAAVVADHLSPTGGFTHARFEALDRAGLVAGAIIPGGETGPVAAPGIAAAIARLLAPDGAVTP
jgi:hypothetical protein